jgi:hypothetical protein
MLYQLMLPVLGQTVSDMVHFLSSHKLILPVLGQDVPNVVHFLSRYK